MRKLLIVTVCSMLCIVQKAWTQTVEISGKVTDSKDLPIPGATVQEKGSRSGTVTDANGAFKMKVKPGAKLVVSSVGFDQQEVAVGTSGLLSIALKEGSQALSEVVVTGTGIATSKKKLGISVESISADKLPSAPTASVDQALVGKIAGAQISSTNGSPGRPTNILLRGINTINRGTSPMILLDGLEVRATDLNSLIFSSLLLSSLSSGS